MLSKDYTYGTSTLDATKSAPIDCAGATMIALQTTVAGTTVIVTPQVSQDKVNWVQQQTFDLTAASGTVKTTKSQNYTLVKDDLLGLPCAGFKYARLLYVSGTGPATVLATPQHDSRGTV